VIAFLILSAFASFVLYSGHFTEIIFVLICIAIYNPVIPNSTEEDEGGTGRSGVVQGHDLY